jgi:Flp pilus assembly protein TadD
MDDAIASDKEALQRKPNNPKYLNDLAWIYATCPKAELRNGTEAVSMAEAACKISKRQDMAMLDTLAAAYAEAGRFDEAVKTTEEIGARAASAHNAKLAETARQRLELYQARKPYRDEQ